MPLPLFHCKYKDVPLSGQNQAVPRSKDSIMTGPMEAVLEEFRLMLLRGGQSSSSSPETKSDSASTASASSVRLPHLVYASSHEVYDWLSTADAPVDKDGKPLNARTATDERRRSAAAARTAGLRLLLRALVLLRSAVIDW